MAKAREAEKVYEAEGADKAQGAKNAVGIEPSTQASLPNAWPELSGGHGRCVWFGRSRRQGAGRSEKFIAVFCL